MAIMARPVLYYGEIRRMMHAENIVRAYSSRAQAENWVAWARANPGLAEILHEAEELCQ